MKKINFKALISWIILLSINIFIIYQQIMYHYIKDNIITSTRWIMDNTIIWYIIYITLIFISITMISYSIWLDNKLSKIWKYWYEIIANYFKKIT